MIYIKVDSLHQGVFRELLEESYVHSVFAHGFNIQGKDALVYVGTDRDEELPGGLVIAPQDFEALKVEQGARAAFDGRRLVLGSSLLDLEGARIFSTRQAPVALEGLLVYLETVVATICSLELETGLGLTISSLLGDPLGLALRDSLDSKDREETSLVLRKIIGRGRGLTPSGDDILLGLLLVDSAFGLLSKDFIACLKELILEEELTTQVSRSYYLGAFRNDYSRDLRDFLDSLVDKNLDDTKIKIQAIIKKGHSSGLDTLAGIALGLDKLLEIRRKP